MPLKFWGEVGWRTSGYSCVCPPRLERHCCPQLSVSAPLLLTAQEILGKARQCELTDPAGCKDAQHKHRKLLRF